jgi:hypothetical protein
MPIGFATGAASMANTPEHGTITGLTPELTNAFKDDLVNLSGEFLAAGFISDDNADKLRNPHNDASHRAAFLVGWIRNRIQLDPETNYCTFIDVLKRRLADHESILKCLDKKYKELSQLTLLCMDCQILSVAT